MSADDSAAVDDVYFCPVSNKDTNTNKSNNPSFCEFRADIGRLILCKSNRDSNDLIMLPLDVGVASVVHPEILTEIGQGHFDTLRLWLAENVHHLGSSLSTDQVVERATGRKLDIGTFKHHLAVRYLGVDKPSTDH